MTSTAYFVCPDYDLPSGGIRVIYRFVDILKSAGITAAVVHSSTEFRCTWFENETKVVCAKNVRLEGGDLLILPEWYRGLIPKIAPGVPHLVLNQNAYETFTGVPFQKGSPVDVVGSDTIGIVVISEDNRKYLELCFPNIKMESIKLSVDTDLFRASPQGKSRAIAYMPRKRLKELNQILHILDLRGALKGWELTPIHGVSEVEAARLLGRSAIFLSLNEREGIALPSLEAMASGCVVVGFHSGSGFEYMRPGAALPINDGEIVSLVLEIESVLQRWGHDETLEDVARTAANLVRREYTRENEYADVVAVFGGTLDRVADNEPRSPLLNAKLLKPEGKLGKILSERLSAVFATNS